MPDLHDWHERVDLEAKAVQRLLKQARTASASSKASQEKEPSHSQGTSEDASCVPDSAEDSKTEPSGEGDDASSRETSSEMSGKRGRELRRGETRDQLLARLLDPTLTLEEAACVLEVCPTTVRRYTNRGILAHERSKGNQRRFKLSSVLAFLESQSRIGPP